jgi:hypothetical protein
LLSCGAFRVRNAGASKGRAMSGRMVPGFVDEVGHGSRCHRWMADGPACSEVDLVDELAGVAIGEVLEYCDPDCL